MPPHPPFPALLPPDHLLVLFDLPENLKLGTRPHLVQRLEDFRSFSAYDKQPIDKTTQFVEMRNPTLFMPTTTSTILLATSLPSS